MTLDLEQTIRQANLITRDTQLDQLFGENSSDRLLQEVLARTEGRMTDISPKKQEKVETSVEAAPARRPRARIGVALAGFAAVIAVAIGLAAINSEGAADTPLEIVDAYQIALAEYDSEGAIALLNVELMRTSWGLPLEELPNELAWFEAVGWTETSTGCAEVRPGPRWQVHCTHTFENDWTRALGVGPYSGYTDYFIEDGKIVLIDGDSDPGTTFSFEAWEVFSRWVATNHNDDLLTLYSDGCCMPNFTPEAAALWEQYTQEFVAEQQG